jgi:YbbR-like protein
MKKYCLKSFDKTFKSMKPSQPKTDYKAIVICLLAAIIFWIMNALNKEGYSEKISFPLQFSYNDSLYIPTQPLPQKISVNVSGSGWSLLRKALAFDITPIKYTISKPLKTRLLNTGSLTDSLSEYIKDVKINYVVADRFELEFDRKISREFRIKIDSSNISLKDRYVITSLINVNPRTITLTGPESVLDEMGNTILVKVPTRRLQENYDDEVPLPLPKNALIKANKDRVTVSFEVAELLK